MFRLNFQLDFGVPIFSPFCIACKDNEKKTRVPSTTTLGRMPLGATKLKAAVLAIIKATPVGAMRPMSVNVMGELAVAHGVSEEEARKMPTQVGRVISGTTSGREGGREGGRERAPSALAHLTITYLLISSSGPAWRADS